MALTIALAKRTEVLLLDEPMASLDPLARREFLGGLLEAATGEGLTVVLSSHILAELERACDYLVILADGEVQLDGEIDRLLDDHGLLVGPPDHAERLAGRLPIVKHSATARQATMLARTGGALGPGRRRSASPWSSSSSPVRAARSWDLRGTRHRPVGLTTWWVQRRIV